jgi:hydrogenase maturation protein HypF
VPTFEIRIAGIVQGVGFRPFVFRQALANNFVGWVINGAQGVCIRFNCQDEATAKNWLDQLILQAPQLSKINNAGLQQVAAEAFQDFTIQESQDDGHVDIPLTPDFAMCEGCRREIDSQSDRRFQYAFITCTNCGPRYSITRKVPYDRPVTTMESYEMCPTCHEEYHNPLERRHFSQTNSCSDCGIKLRIYDSSEHLFLPIHDENAKVDFAVQAIENGQILAVKGIGGYLLMCDATDDTVISLLRKRKHRPDKPLAVIYPNIEMVEERFEVSQSERATLLSPEAPIVLLRSQGKHRLSKEIAPGLDNVGVMLPYAPLLYMISQKVGIPLVATSGNISGSPIIYQDEDAINELQDIADWIISHDREILIPQDDSVIRITRENQQKIILRRSRGLAPNYHGEMDHLSNLNGCLAVGAEMKGAFALIHQNRCYISQYLGSMGDLISQQSFEKVLGHLTNVLSFESKKLISDLHPGYFGYSWCQEHSETQNVSWNSYQHHEAHFAAVLGEHGLHNRKEQVLGFVWDGTGLSPDNQIWGSETFLWDGKTINHLGNIGYVRHFSGDRMAAQPRLSLLTFTSDQENQEAYVKPFFTDMEWTSYTKVKELSKLRTSSMGRLFDAMACLLTDTSETSFEGQAAMYLEVLALEGRKECHLDDQWEIEIDRDFYQQVVDHVFDSLKEGQHKSVIAYLFHEYLVKWVEVQAIKFEINKLAFSGGVFQNGLLVDLIINRLSDRFELLFHKELSPNDENIAFGQLVRESISRSNPKSGNQSLKKFNQTYEIRQ